MRLLEYETIDGQEGSYNDMIKQLVIKVRYYYSQVSGDEFKAAIPELQSIEAKIQRLDNEFGNEDRNYLTDLLDELREEGEIESALMDDFKRTTNTVFDKLLEQRFDESEFSFAYNVFKGVCVLEFYGYIEDKAIDKSGRIVRDILQSICNKYKVVFIDSSSNS